MHHDELQGRIVGRPKARKSAWGNIRFLHTINELMNTIPTRKEVKKISHKGFVCIPAWWVKKYGALLFRDAVTTLSGQEREQRFWKIMCGSSLISATKGM